MKEKFDFDRIGKRMPYTTPDGFFDDMENSIMQCIKQEVRPLKPKRNLQLWYSLVIVFAPFHTQTKKSFEDVEEAFANLSSSDQDYLFTTYQYDLFMNE